MGLSCWWHWGKLFDFGAAALVPVAAMKRVPDNSPHLQIMPTAFADKVARPDELDARGFPTIRA